MKTVEEWAQELPEDVREKFLANVVRVHGEDVLKWKFSFLSGAIGDTFYWKESLEGHDFWNDIHEQLESESR